LIFELENICSLANNSQEVGHEKYLGKKNEYCDKFKRYLFGNERVYKFRLK
jgi:hypothetical protein